MNNQSEEELLREQLRGLSIFAKGFGFDADVLIDFITQHTEQAVLGARIDEMQQLLDREAELWRLAGSEANPSGEPVDAEEYAAERLTQLNKLKEK